MKFIVHIIVLLLSSACFAQVKDYSELKFVYSDLVDALKSESDQKLKDFCSRLVTDETTLEFMRKNSLCYRGIPCKMEEQGMEMTEIVNKFYPSLLSLRNSLKQNGHLAKLKHIDSTEYKWDIEIFINEKVEGNDKPVRQDHYSTSMEKYSLALSKADSIGKPMEELILNGRKGDVIIIKGTEMSISLKSGNKMISYRIGEMVCINNKWSLFTQPNDYYNVQEE